MLEGKHHDLIVGYGGHPPPIDFVAMRGQRVGHPSLRDEPQGLGCGKLLEPFTALLQVRPERVPLAAARNGLVALDNVASLAPLAGQRFSVAKVNTHGQPMTGLAIPVCWSYRLNRPSTFRRKCSRRRKGHPLPSRRQIAAFARTGTGERLDRRTYRPNRLRGPRECSVLQQTSIDPSTRCRTGFPA